MKIRIRLTREDNAQRYGVSAGSTIALDVETYLKGVLPSEIYESRTPREAKKALAIAARTYAYRAALDGGTLSDTPASQSYRAALADTSPLCCEAVDATRGQVLSYRGEIIRCYYSRSNGGQTKRTDQVWSASLPYYKARADPWDKAARAEAAAQAKPSRPVMAWVCLRWAQNTPYAWERTLRTFWPFTIPIPKSFIVRM